MAPTSSNMLSNYHPHVLYMPVYKFAFNIFANAKNTGAGRFGFGLEMRNSLIEPYGLSESIDFKAEQIA